MADISLRKRVWGWYFFDWASQPYNTLLLTFIFGPYVKELIGDGTQAQIVWSAGITVAGIIIAVLSPILGAIADTGGARKRWIWIFSVAYVVGAYGLWWTAPDNFNVFTTLSLFALGLIGMEFATTFTNSYLPDLAARESIGRISGNGWAFGYLGGFVALVIMLVFFAESAESGKTFVGLSPALGLDPAMREGTRAVGPLTAIWYAVFMIPFFLFVRDPRPVRAAPGAVRRALSDLGRTLRRLPSRRSLFAYLVSSMFYRDALNAIYAIGGVYAAGALDWGAVNSGIFGIIAIVSGVVFTWLGGRADARFGAKPVIAVNIIIMTLVVITVASISRTTVLGFTVAETSKLPDYVFYLVGAIIGGAGGTLQAASRTMMVYQAERDRMTEAFGLYALTGKATSFLAPGLILLTTWASGSQQIGITPLIGLFLIGLFLLVWVKPDGDPRTA
jgi:UMF1 family MFS transporter